MSRWGKNIVVPLDSLCKEKENTNRPTVARSVGTVGKWGKMGFTSTRTYTLSALHPMAAAAAAAAAAASPAQSPASTHDHDPNDLSVSVPEPPKPKKFFKSRNAAPPEVIAQIIQQLPHCIAATSPMREPSSSAGGGGCGGGGGSSGGGGGAPSTPVHRDHPIKLRLTGKGNNNNTNSSSSNSAERKRKSPKKKATGGAGGGGGGATTTPGALSTADSLAADIADAEPGDTQLGTTAEPKTKKTKRQKEEKKLKPEAPPSRILGRARKAVNYCEVDDDERYPTPIKDLIIPKTSTAAATTADVSSTLPPPICPVSSAAPSTTGVITSSSSSSSTAAAGASSAGTSAIVPSASSSASRTPEHPPIVLRISKGTSRLVSTDSEEPPNGSPAQQQIDLDSSTTTITTTTTAATAVAANISSSSSGSGSSNSDITAADASRSTSCVTTAAAVVNATGVISVVDSCVVKVPASSTPKIIVKPPRPPPQGDHQSLIGSESSAAAPAAVAPKEHNINHANNNDNEEEEEDEDDDEEEEEEEDEEEEPPEINYCTVKISPDKPPKERLKLIIKTDVIRNAIAKAAAAAAAKAADSRSEKKSKSRKHKHLKHANIAAIEQQQQQQSSLSLVTPPPPPTPAQPLIESVASSITAPSASASVVAPISIPVTTQQAAEFKTPSPHLALSEQQQQQQQQHYHQQQHHHQQQQQHHHLHHHHRGTVISPTTRSDHDFDSQSSVLGSISSKGNSTPQLLAQAVQEDSCVIRSRGSSVITSDLETSQHSSLVAPPSDIESRLESMMMTMDGGGVSGSVGQVLAQAQPLQQDILAVLRGDADSITPPSTTTTTPVTTVTTTTSTTPKVNGSVVDVVAADEATMGRQSKRPTRGRARKPITTNNVTSTVDITESTATPPPQPPPPSQRTRGTRGKAAAAAAVAAATTTTIATSTTTTTTPTTTISKRATRARGKNLPIAMDIDDDEQPQQVVASQATEPQPPQLASSSPSSSSSQIQPQAEPELTRRGRGTRANNNNVTTTTTTTTTKNNNNNNNNNNNINKIAANLSAKAESASKPSPADRERDRERERDRNRDRDRDRDKDRDGIVAKVTRGRKRKSQQIVKQIRQPHDDNDNENNNDDDAAAAAAAADNDDDGHGNGNENNEDDDDGDADSVQPQAKIPHRELDLDLPDDELSNNSNNSSLLQHDGSSSSPPPRDFKIKDKFKRTITLESQVAKTAADAAVAAAAAAAAAALVAASASSVTQSVHQSAATSTEEEVTAGGGSGGGGSGGATAAAASNANESRGAVKLVISKKKGSIFKSRTLAPSDQAEQASVAKRHLYKHSWDAALEANGGGTGSDASSASPSGGAGGGASSKSIDSHTAAAAKANADAIYADFGDSSSNNNTCTSASALATGIGGLGGTTIRGDSPSMGKLARVGATSATTELDVDDEAAIMATGGSSGGGPMTNATRDDNAGVGSAGGGVRVDRKAKDYYRVVRNVKTAHQIQEIGEYQEMDDDVEYILDALQPHNPPPTRCLSALQLATKCMAPAFRMHVRAHGVVTKFFKALSDANKDLSLGLCTSAIMYVLSQEVLNMDLDRDSLELMINLLEAEGVAAPSDRANYERNKQKVRDLCEEIKAQGKGTHLNVESITVGTLAMETLLSLTSKRAGEWFKEDLRKLGGLEHIIKTISDFCQPVIDAPPSIVWHQSLLDNMQTVARCLRVLENVTQHNEANQRYMLTFANGRAVDTLCMLYSLCDRTLRLHPTTMEQCTSTSTSSATGSSSSSSSGSGKDHPGVAMRELLVPVMKVLINLTHTFNEAQPSLGAELLGKRDDVIATSFHLLLLVSNYIPDRCVFELSILVLTLLINLTMHTVGNRATLMQASAPPDYVADNPPMNGEQKVSALQALLEYFYKCEELAKLVEKNTDAFLENNEKSKKKQEEVEETVNNLVQRAGHHMEHTLKGSYAAILIGNLIADNEQHEAIVRRQLRGESFKEISGVLEKYHTFMNLTASMEAAFVAHMKSTKKIIENFKKRDYIHDHADEHTPLPLNLETPALHEENSTATSNTTTTTTSSSSSSSSSNTTSNTNNSNMPRVYKTYSSHR